jgi:hypothetical protein
MPFTNNQNLWDIKQNSRWATTAVCDVRCQPGTQSLEVATPLVSRKLVISDTKFDPSVQYQNRYKGGSTLDQWDGWTPATLRAVAV